MIPGSFNFGSDGEGEPIETTLGIISNSREKGQEHADSEYRATNLQRAGSKRKRQEDSDLMEKINWNTESAQDSHKPADVNTNIDIGISLEGPPSFKRSRDDTKNTNDMQGRDSRGAECLEYDDRNKVRIIAPTSFDDIQDTARNINHSLAKELENAYSIIRLYESREQDTQDTQKTNTSTLRSEDLANEMNGNVSLQQERDSIQETFVEMLRVHGSTTEHTELEKPQEALDSEKAQYQLFEKQLQDANIATQEMEKKLHQTQIELRNMANELTEAKGGLIDSEERLIKLQADFEKSDMEKMNALYSANQLAEYYRTLLIEEKNHCNTISARNEEQIAEIIKRADEELADSCLLVEETAQIYEATLEDRHRREVAEKCKAEVEKAAAMAKQSQDALASKEVELREAKLAISQQKHELDASLESRRLLEGECERILQQMDDIQKNYNGKLADQRERAEAHRLEISQLDEVIRDLQAQLRQSGRNEQSDKRRLEEELRATKRSNEQERLKLLTDHSSKLNAQSREHQIEVDRLREEERAMKNQLADVNILLQEKSELVISLEQSKLGLETELDNQARKMEELVTAQNTVQNELEQFRSQCEQLSKIVEQQAKDIAEEESMVVTLNREVERLTNAQKSEDIYEVENNTTITSEHGHPNRVDKGKGKERERTPVLDHMLREVRCYMNKLLEIKQDSSITTAYENGHFITEEEYEAFEEGTMDFEDISIDFLRPYWKKPKCSYNALLAEDFTEKFVAENPEFEDHREEVSTHFIQRIGSLKAHLSLALSKAGESEAQRQERTARKNKAVRQNTRRYNGYNRRVADVKARAEIDPAYAPVLETIECLGEYGYSSDETDTSVPRGQGYLVRRKLWRNKKLRRVIKMANDCRRTTNINGNSLPGAQQRPRRYHDSYGPISAAPAPVGKPINYYDSDFLDELSATEFRVLRPTSPRPFIGEEDED
ncbi:hypothetical protein JR316_0012550 [Psilocybe cubensis]|nr:hypothetical protein JR316_0012550 [Psilocybe cubensis]KAH9475439.1 hypothetical protein JR316_0012550 [Psilocybe cubensis]